MPKKSYPEMSDAAMKVRLSGKRACFGKIGGSGIGHLPENCRGELWTCSGCQVTFCQNPFHEDHDVQEGCTGMQVLIFAKKHGIKKVTSRNNRKLRIDIYAEWKEQYGTHN